jgi:hypothetical protein
MVCRRRRTGGSGGQTGDSRGQIFRTQAQIGHRITCLDSRCGREGGCRDRLCHNFGKLGLPYARASTPGVQRRTIRAQLRDKVGHLSTPDAQASRLGRRRSTPVDHTSRRYARLSTLYDQPNPSWPRVSTPGVSSGKQSVQVNERGAHASIGTRRANQSSEA